MAVRDILRMGNSSLLEPALPVAAFATPQLRALVSDMLDTMRAANGAGLAAPQIGVDVQLVIFGSRERNPRYPDRPVVPPTVVKQYFRQRLRVYIGVSKYHSPP